jgi:hypothetical protein
MQRQGLVNLQDQPFRIGVSPVAERPHGAEFGQVAGVIPARRPAGPQRRAVMDKEAAVFSIVGVQGQPQQAPRLPFRLQGHQPVANVQERLFQDARADGDNLNQAGLVGHKETAAAVIGGGQGHGGGKALGHRRQPHRQGGRGQRFGQRLASCCSSPLRPALLRPAPA